MSDERTTHEQLVDQLEARRQQCQRFHPFDVPCADCDLWRDAAALLRAQEEPVKNGHYTQITDVPTLRRMVRRAIDDMAEAMKIADNARDEVDKLRQQIAGEASPAHSAAPPQDQGKGRLS